MSKEEYKNITRRFIEDYHMSLSAFPDFAPQTLFHFGSLPEPLDLATAGHLGDGLAAAFPDLEATVDDMLVEGDKLVCRWTARGTQLGELNGIPATGRRVTFSGICIERFENNKIVEHWVNMDQFGILQQLGVIPAPAAA